MVHCRRAGFRTEASRTVAPKSCPAVQNARRKVHSTGQDPTPARLRCVADMRTCMVHVCVQLLLAHHCILHRQVYRSENSVGFCVYPLSTCPSQQNIANLARASIVDQVPLARRPTAHPTAPVSSHTARVALSTKRLSRAPSSRATAALLCLTSRGTPAGVTNSPSRWPACSLTSSTSS